VIAKRAARRNDSRSSFQALAAYLLDAGHGGAKVAFSQVTNCLADDPGLAVKEIEATQALNRRTKNDKTYHLVVSFRAGERPTEAQLRDIEREVCEAIGFGDHQRLSALHTDTDNLHLHIAINKVHPRTRNCIEPYYDKYKLGDICRVLELRYGLERDPHIGQHVLDASERRAAGRPGDMERHAGVESFRSWVKGAPAAALAEVLDRPEATWHDLHRALARFDLTLRPRGAGLVIGHRTLRLRSGQAQRLFVKASDVARALGRAALEQRLGPFEAPDPETTATAPETSYHPRPLHRHAYRERLYQAYRRERDEWLTLKRRRLEDLTRKREARVKEIQVRYTARRLEVLRDGMLGKRIKHDLYAKLKTQRLAEQKALRAEFARRRAAIHAEHPVMAWQTWFMARAARGDAAALAVLRTRRTPVIKGVGSEILQGTPPFDTSGNDPEVSKGGAQVFSGLRHRVHANGDVTYELANGERFRDEGPRLRLAGAEASAVEAALRIAQAKFGPCLEVQGSEAFRRQVLEVVVSRGLPVRFSDAALEEARQAHLGASRTSGIDASIPQQDRGGRTRTGIER
jgi:hypothetical protein